MARTTEEDVRLAIATNLESAQVAAFIDDASLWVTTHLASTGQSDDVLAAIEKYLACHFITLRDPRLKAGKFGDTTETFQRDSEVTEYLKAAIALDASGVLQDLFGAKRQRFRFRVGTGYA